MLYTRHTIAHYSPIIFIAACFIVALIPINEKTSTKTAPKSILVHKITAFSLRKQIELTAESHPCPNRPPAARHGRPWTQFGPVHVFSAHHDQRLHPYGYIRLIAMLKGPISPFYCQIRSENDRFHASRAFFTEIWRRQWNANDTHAYYHPYLISCQIPDNFRPESVSLSRKPCVFTDRSVKIRFENEVTRQFTVCVKPVNFSDDISAKLVQWIAINSVFLDKGGRFEFFVDKMAAGDVTLGTLRALAKRDERIRVRFLPKLGGAMADEGAERWQRRRYELVAYNACLYGALAASSYVVPVDLDEVIVPRPPMRSWPHLMASKRLKRASYTVSNAYYLRDFQVKGGDDGVFLFRDVVRAEFSPDGESGKSFVATNETLTVGHHGALEALRPGVQLAEFLGTRYVQMNHYRDGCDAAVLPQCARYLASRVRIVDGVVGAFKHEFYAKYNELLKLLSAS